MSEPTPDEPLTAAALHDLLEPLHARAVAAGLPANITGNLEMALACAHKVAREEACAHAGVPIVRVGGGSQFSRCPNCGKVTTTKV